MHIHRRRLFASHTDVYAIVQVLQNEQRPQTEFYIVVIINTAKIERKDGRRIIR